MMHMDNCIIYGGQLLTESEHRCAQIIEALGVWCAYSDAVRNSIRHYRLNESIDVACHLDDIDEAIIYFYSNDARAIEDNKLEEYYASKISSNLFILEARRSSLVRL